MELVLKSRIYPDGEGGWYLPSLSNQVSPSILIINSPFLLIAWLLLERDIIANMWIALSTKQAPLSSAYHLLFPFLALPIWRLLATAVFLRLRKKRSFLRAGIYQVRLWESSWADVAGVRLCIIVRVCVISLSMDLLYWEAQTKKSLYFEWLNKIGMSTGRLVNPQARMHGLF